MAPFIAMSFLLGGIDFVTILRLAAGPVHVVAVGVRGLPVSVALCSSRARCPVLVLGGVAIVMFLFLLVFGCAESHLLLLSRGAFAGGTVFSVGAGAGSWWGLAIATTAGLATMVESGAARREPAVAAD